MTISPAIWATLAIIVVLIHAILARNFILAIFKK